MQVGKEGLFTLGGDWIVSWYPAMRGEGDDIVNV